MNVNDGSQVTIIVEFMIHLRRQQCTYNLYIVQKDNSVFWGGMGLNFFLHSVDFLLFIL